MCANRSRIRQSGQAGTRTSACSADSPSTSSITRRWALGPLRNAVHGAHLTGAGARDATVVLAVGPAQLPDRVRSTGADLCRAGPPGLASDRMRAAG